MAQPRQDPALHHQHADLDLGLVARPAHPRRQDRRAVVRRQVAVGRVDPRLIPVRSQHAGAQVVRHDLARHAAQEFQRAHVRADPVRQALRPARLGVGVVRRAQHGDEHLRRAQLAGAAVHHLHRLPGVVDEQPLAGSVHLSHGRRQPRLPAAVQLAPTAVAVTAASGRRGIPPRAAAASRPGGAARGGSTAQSGSALCRLPGSEPPSGANSSASRPCSVSVAGSGQLSPAAANRARHSCTVLRATLTATAIARSELPHSNFNRRISRTRRIDTLSAGIGPPWLCYRILAQ